MKTMIALAAVAAALATTTTHADAKSKSRCHHHDCGGRYVYVEKPARYAPYAARYETHDDIRARNVDPTGQYAAYPSWARVALGRSGRR